jgi:hypothetical protein
MALKGNNGVTTGTPEKIFFGAGTIHKGLIFDSTSNTFENFENSLVGATNGGSTLTITPEVTKVEVDGVYVSVKGLNVKTGEIATLETNFATTDSDVMTSMVIGGKAAAGNYDVISSKPDINYGDYWDNIAFVGETLPDANGVKKDVVAILPNALCTSGLAINGQSKTQAVYTATFECNATPDGINGQYDYLPYKIYYGAETTTTPTTEN